MRASWRVLELVGPRPRGSIGLDSSTPRRRRRRRRPHTHAFPATSFCLWLYCIYQYVPAKKDMVSSLSFFVLKGENYTLFVDVLLHI